MNWLMDNMGDIIVILFVGALLYLCAASLFRSKRSGVPGCACSKNCATCALRYVHGMAQKKV